MSFQYFFIFSCGNPEEASSDLKFLGEEVSQKVGEKPSDTSESPESRQSRVCFLLHNSHLQIQVIVRRITLISGQVVL